MVICVLACIVWLKHFPTMGAGGGGKSSLGIMTKIIAVATGRKVLDWLLFEVRNRVSSSRPMLRALGFVIGGMIWAVLVEPRRLRFERRYLSV